MDSSEAEVKEEIAKFANKNCTQANCLMCKEGDKYGTYRKCPFLPLKIIGRDRKVTVEDVPDTFDAKPKM